MTLEDYLLAVNTTLLAPVTMARSAIAGVRGRGLFSNSLMPPHIQQRSEVVMTALVALEEAITAYRDDLVVMQEAPSPEP